MISMRAYIDIINEASMRDTARRLKTTAVMVSRERDPAEKARMLDDLRNQLDAAEKLAATMEPLDQKALLAVIAMIRGNAGLAAPEPEEDDATATPMRTASSTQPDTAPPPKEGKWQTVRQAKKPGPNNTVILSAILAKNGEFVYVIGPPGQYRRTPPGSRDNAESYFTKALRSGFKEVSPGRSGV